MGRLKSAAVPRPTPNRREFVKRSSGVEFALGAAPLLQACGGGDSDDPPAKPRAPIGRFEHGVASGDPLADRVILWTRVTPAAAGSVAVDCVVASDSSLANIVTGTSTTTDATRDYTVNVDVAGLQPNTTYYYRFSIAGAQSPVGRTRTLPGGHGHPPAHGRRALCEPGARLLNAYRRIAERGDFDLRRASLRLHVRIRQQPIRIAAGLRARDVDAKRLPDTARAVQARQEPAQVRRQHSMVAIWDDHEFADNAHVDGAANHTEGAEGTWGARVAAAMQAYYESMQVRVVDAIDRRRNNRSLRLWQLGRLDHARAAARCTLAATADRHQRLRCLRSKRRGSGAEPSDARQRAGGLACRSIARIHHPVEDRRTRRDVCAAEGRSYAQCRRRRPLHQRRPVGRLPAGTRPPVRRAQGRRVPSPPVDNVVMLTGDMHSSWAADLTQDPNNPDTATGGYDPATGAGSRAVEFVATSVTSPLVVNTVIPESAVKLINPHFKYIELTRRGYMLLDVDATRVVGEWWYVDTIETRSQGQSFGVAFQVQNGAKRLIPATQTTPRADAAALAP